MLQGQKPEELSCFVGDGIDFRRSGEIEGLSIDPVNDDLVVLNNRGTLIVLGMSQGPFKEEGYTGEIHELYIYEKVK